MGPMLMIVFFHCLNPFSILLKLYLGVCVQSLSLPDPGIESASLAFPSLADRFFTTSATWEAHMYVYEVINIYIYIIYVMKLKERAPSLLNQMSVGIVTFLSSPVIE